MADSGFVTNGSTAQPVLQGLVLAGGKSTRMGRSKHQIDYHGLPQLKYCVNLLSSFNIPVFVSLRAGQSRDLGIHGVAVIEDQVENSGPMGAILSAFAFAPTAAWLVMACDMPFVTRETILDLINSRDPLVPVTAFLSANQQMEPLLAIYEPSSRSLLQDCMDRGERSLRAAFGLMDYHGICAERADELTNINTPEEYLAARERLKC